jgi:hypothetical protein
MVSIMSEDKLYQKLNAISGLLPECWEFNISIEFEGYNTSLTDENGNEIEFSQEFGIENDVDSCLEYLEEMKQESDIFEDFKQTKDYKYEIEHGKQLEDIIIEAKTNQISCSKKVCMFFDALYEQNCSKSIGEGMTVLPGIVLCKKYIPTRITKCCINNNQP